MSIKRLVPHYQTSDKATFEDEAEAKRWQKMLDAKAEFDKAVVPFVRALAAVTHTADNQPFQFEYRKKFYLLSNQFVGTPRIREVEVSWHDVLLRPNEGNHSIDVQVRQGDTVEYVPVTDLYALEASADQALLETYEKRKQWLEEDIAEVEQRMAKNARSKKVIEKHAKA